MLTHPVYWHFADSFKKIFNIRSSPLYKMIETELDTPNLKECFFVDKLKHGFENQVPKHSYMYIDK